MRRDGWREFDGHFEAEPKVEISVERILGGNFTVTDLESLPDTAWQQESWRNALTGAWLNMTKYRNGDGNHELDSLRSDLADFMRRHDVLVPSATVGRIWANVLRSADKEDVLAVIERFRVEDPVDDPEAAVGFFLVEGIALGYPQQIDALLAAEEIGQLLDRVPTEYATRRLVNLLDSGRAHPALALVRLMSGSLEGLRAHPLFPKCLEQFFASVIAREDESVREEALQNFGSLLGEDGVRQAAAEAVWLMLDPYKSTGDVEGIIRRFDLDENMLAGASSRRWMTSRMFGYFTLENPSAAKEVIERYSAYPGMRSALEDSLAHHVAKQNMAEHWRSSLGEQPDPWVEEVATKARHKELCWSLRIGKVEEVERAWDERGLEEREQKEYQENGLLGFREVCARGRTEEAVRLRDLLEMTEEATSPVVTQTVKELIAATYFEDAKRLADQFSVPERSIRELIVDAKERFLHDGDPQLAAEMHSVFDLPSDAVVQESTKTDVEKEAREKTEMATPDVLHETVRFYVNESLVAAGKKLREKFARRGLSVPFRAAMVFEPVIQAAEEEIMKWQEYVREVLLNGVVTEMIRNQNQVEDPEHTIVEDYDNASYEDTEAWRSRADDADVRRVLRQSTFRYGLAGWGSDRGGRLWQRVSEIGLTLFSPPFPNTRAVDEAYDLAHHHGTFLVEPWDLTAVVLDVKRKAKDVADMLEQSRPYVDSRVLAQLKSRLSSMEEAERAVDRALAGYARYGKSSQEAVFETLENAMIVARIATHKRTMSISAPPALC